MALTVYEDLEQGTDEWLQARCGVLTASVIGQLITPTGKVADNKIVRRLAADLLSQRITGVVEEIPQTYDMQRGHEDEIEAKIAYAGKIAPVKEIGFMVEDKWGFKIGYSPDGLVGDDGLIECKSRAHGLQFQVICSRDVPAEYMAQIQTGLMVSGRNWIDFISFPALGGGKMMVKRVYTDAEYQALLIDAATQFETRLAEQHAEYMEALKDPTLRFIDVERRAMEEDIVI
ncbi:YqaJ viral recombinase family protein [Komagataeibacter oboediens]|uniref:lambda exonuclease family protein n=1 Tax=Komagataeibacter oboediens TaxID=65958 RepID=UPI0023DA8599|nr:lambda exonuclease family protein [Komagataeibacter oboediens]WEQ51175.1 YqaJ viral recombinase family protein [Komagataeibacter oboediens]